MARSIDRIVGRFVLCIRLCSIW